MYNIKI